MEDIKDLTQEDLMDVEGGEIGGWFSNRPIWILSGLVAPDFID